MLFLPPLLGCSIYFNTFYNAETAFDEGYKIHEKVMKNYPDSLVVQPPEAAKAKYDRAVEKSIKVLDVFPKDKKWHDDALFLLGKTYFYEKEFGKSLRRLRQLQEEYPGSPFVPESYLYCAKDYIGNEDLEKAEETLKFALDRYPFLDKDQKISLLLVEIGIIREGKSQAITLLEKVRSSVRSAEKRTELLIRVAELYMSMQQYDRAIPLLRKAPRDKKDPLRMYRIDQDLVSCYVAAGSMQKALDLLKAMLADKQYVAYIKQMLFVKGTILASLDRIDEAIAVYKQIVGATRTGDTNAVKNDTSRVINKAWYELGLLYQKRKNNYKEAEKYFRLVGERTVQDSLVNGAAAKRLNAMKYLVEHRKALATGDTTMKRPARLFKIGELFYYELDEPDSASRQFLAIAGDSTVDSAITPKALFSAAYIIKKHFKDTARSDSLYRSLVKRFPESEYVRRAQKEMRSPSMVRTRKELADSAFREAEITYWEGTDTKTAVQSFFAVYKEFPDLDIAAKSLFAAAWIADNDLQKKKVVKSLYEKICERYPQSVYCVKEAQPRLKVVLDTLEALRRQGQTSAGGKTDTGADSLGSRSPADSNDAAIFDTLSGGGTAVKSDSAASATAAPGTSRSDSSQKPQVPPPAPDSKYFRGHGRYMPPAPADTLPK